MEAGAGAGGLGGRIDGWIGWDGWIRGTGMEKGTGGL